MPDPRDFLPMLPWEGPPLPRGRSVNPSRTIKLLPDEYANPRWGEIATRNYAYSLGWTEKITGEIAWHNPRNRKQYVKLWSSNKEPRTITIYNSKIGAREILAVVLRDF